MNDALTRLAAANPVPPEARSWVAQELQLDALQPRVPVRRVSPRIGVAVAAALLACVVLLVAPALGLDIPGIDFFRAHKAPARVVKDFASMSEYAPPGMDPRVIAGQARTVTTLHTATGTHTLWVAPTRLGGFCYGWSKGAGGCDARGVLPLAVTWMSPDRVEPGTLPPRAFGSVEGHVHAPWADGVEIHLSDGSTVQPKLTWVSKPIDAGFFYYDAQAGVSVRSVVATKSGDAVDADETGAGGVEPTPDRFVLAKEKQAVAVLETSAGRATIWVAPTKTNKICRWLELGRTHLPVTPCLPSVYGVQGLPLRYVTIDRVRLLYGAAGPRYRSVHVTFPDGHELALRPQRQFFLSEVTQPVSRLTVHATDRAGRTTTILLALAPAAP